LPHVVSILARKAEGRESAEVILELLFVAAGCTAPDSTEVVGLWESQRRSKGGIGHAIELRPNGTYMEGSVVLADMRYRVADGQLIEMDGNGPTERVVRTTSFQINGRSLVEKSVDGQEVTKVRAGSSSSGVANLLAPHEGLLQAVWEPALFYARASGGNWYPLPFPRTKVERPLK
jgi:hypothetical protein